MNLYQSLNNWASGFIFAAALAGVYKLIGDNHLSWQFISVNADSIFLVVFIVYFRIKMHLDDHKYFRDFEKDRSKYKYFGLLVAVAVWFLLALAAGTIYNPDTSVVMLAIAFAMSTAWIAVHLMEIALNVAARSSLKAVTVLRLKWILINMSYITLLMLYSWGADLTLSMQGHSFDITKWGFIALMIVVMICDHFISEPHAE